MVGRRTPDPGAVIHARGSRVRRPAGRIGRAVTAALCGLSTALAGAPARAACPAGAGDCEALVENGHTGARIDLVILGDGYTQAERDKFHADAATVLAGLLGSETYSAYQAVFNAYALFTPSAESGADHPSQGVLVDTAFDATYESAGIDYLLVVDPVKILLELNSRFPEKDVAVVLVNDEEYGGSGGQVAVFSLEASALEIGRHELGHTFAGLADEYTAPFPGYPDGDPEPNVALATNLDPVKWEDWLTPGVTIPTPDADAAGPHEPIGAFEGARYKETGVFRPAPSCLMRELDAGFCPVCAEAMVLSFSRLSALIDAPVPASPAVIPAGGSTTFSATIADLADLTFAWTVDGAPIAESGPSLALDPSALGLGDGLHKVALTVSDGSPLVRSDPSGAMKETFTWLIAVDSTLTPGTVSTGSGGNDGSGGMAGSGGTGGVGGAGEGGSCGCWTAGQGPAPSGWAALGLAVLALALRRNAGHPA